MRTRTKGRREGEVEGAPRRQARMGLYALWQLRDYLFDRGAPTIIVASLGGYLTGNGMLSVVNRQLAALPPRVIEKWGGPEGARAMLFRDMNDQFVRSFLGSLVFLAAIFAMNGIVANDRKQGYYRFLFAKPVSPVRLYGQAFLVHFAGFIGIAALLALMYGAFVFPIISVQLMTVMIAVFLCYAGVAFLLSAAARWDWLSLVAVTVFATFAWSKFDESTSIFARLLYLLPPVHRTSDVYAAVVKGTPSPDLLWWFAGYGAACYLLGLVVLRYRRLAVA